MAGVHDHDLPRELSAWLARGRRVRTTAGSVFVIDEGPREAPAILVLHGFPTSSYDFHDVLPLLTRSHRVVLHDHLGFGLSDKPADYSYSLFEQTDAALEVWRALDITSGHVVGHDYGTSVATELVARHVRGILPIAMRSLTLSNGSVILELAKLMPIQKLLRTKWVGPLIARGGTAMTFKTQMRRLFAQPKSLSDREVAVLWAGVTRADGLARLPAIARYIDERARFHHRWVPALARFGRPCHLLWGRRDPVARQEIATQLAAEIHGSRLTWLEDVGHYPMLEAPARWADGILGFLESSQRDQANPAGSQADW